jgi:hypothetical protein
MSMSNLLGSNRKDMNTASDLQTAMLNLRGILSKKSSTNMSVDSNVSQSIAAIISQIELLTSLAEPRDIFNALQSSLSMYINDFLSMNNCPMILADDSFQNIFHTLVGTESAIDFDSLYKMQPHYARTVCYNSFDLLSLGVIDSFLRGKYADKLFSHLSTIVKHILLRIQSTTEYVTFKRNDLQNRV